MMRTMLKTFLTNLGGVKAVAEGLTALTGHSVEENAVHQWPYRKSIPHRWRPWVAKLAKKKRLAKSDVPEEVRSFMQ